MNAQLLPQVLASVLLIALLAVPIVLYLAYGWKAKRKGILDSFTDKAILLYLRTFFPAEYARLVDEIKDKSEDQKRLSILQFFQVHHDSRYGRHHFVLPTILVLGIGSFIIIIGVNAVVLWLDDKQSALYIPAVALAGVAGAYMWVLYDLIYRERRLDLSPNHLLWASFRLVIAIPFAFALTALFAKTIAVSIAFLVGAFPTEWIMRTSRRLVNQQLKLPQEDEKQSQWSKLQGIDQSIIDRFAQEGVTTVLYLAYCDPVDLTIRSSYPFSLILDCVSQALAWVYLEDNLVDARHHSLRGALEIVGFIEDLDDDDEADFQKMAREILNKLAHKVGKDPAIIEWSIRAAYDDLHVDFVCEAFWATRAAVEYEGIPSLRRKKT